MTPGGRRPSSAPAPLNFEHPYLDGKLPKKNQKRELGIIDLVVFKMFGCFTADDLPPPNPDATVYQAGGKSSSSSTTFTSAGTNTTLPPSAAPPVPPPPQPQPTSGRRRIRSERHSKPSAWSDDKVHMPKVNLPDTTRTTVERTQFVEQRAEERKKEAHRKLEEERSKAVEQAAESSAAMAIEAAQKDGRPAPQPPFIQHNRVVSGASSIDRLFPFDRESRSDADTSERSHREPVPASDDRKVAMSAGAGRVSRLSAMFEQ